MNLYHQFHEKYDAGEDDRMVALRTQEILNKKSDPSKHKEMLKTIFSCIDLTTLNTQDNEGIARTLCLKVNEFPEKYPEMPEVAALCVYPPLVQSVREHLHRAKIKLAAVGAGFPSSQTFISVKLAECKILLSKGADEIDVVLSVGRFLGGDYERVFNEIKLIKETLGEIHLKVILETGILRTAQNIRMASLLAIEAGADFIKTSTGKTEPAATPEAAYVMCKAIRDYYSHTGQRVGFKPAGGIANPDEAIKYYKIVHAILGKEWLNPGLFRIGASRLSNAILSAVLEHEQSYF